MPSDHAHHLLRTPRGPGITRRHSLQGLGAMVALGLPMAWGCAGALSVSPGATANPQSGAVLRTAASGPRAGIGLR